MEAHALSFNGTEICDVVIDGRNLIITNYDDYRLFAIHLYIGYTLKRFDFLKIHKKRDNEIHYPLRSIDILILIREGFKFTSS